MTMTSIDGVIKRRLLINYQLNPDIAETILPHPFRPKTIKGKAIIGVCLIRLENIRPTLLSSIPVGMSSENAAHRIAVEWDENGETKEGVYIFRRDTNSKLNSLVGGRIFPGTHQLADFQVNDTGNTVEFSMESKDKEVNISIKGKEHDKLQPNSVFQSIAEISSFFKSGANGYSPDKKGECHQGLCLHTNDWTMTPFKAEEVKTTYLGDVLNISDHDLEFDSVVLMRNIQHKWEKLSGIPS
ncbi:hypothetical protein E3U55_07430 [Filobacillus milosensis]|uniref:DUF2071 domain-containing protein n=1 Tax=Filobacillus milosensis TaxID=94137 RepID=A0A4Y8ILH3_9BACI|nr:DUF2071 domain-containing protein [Filobacillus milosensis]TFB22125.1 hypothetical protein E3U55_07430 [Filobacillus milosensis]